MIHVTYDRIADTLSKSDDISTGQMFGKPCLKTGKKAFAAWFKTEMVFKLGQEEITLIKQQFLGSINWDPSGKNRAMKDWLQVPEEYSDHWETLAKQAMTFVKENK